MSSNAEDQYTVSIQVTQAQRESYEKAAALRGQTLAQWATSHLDEHAQKDMSEACTVLAPEAFDAFLKALDKPMPEATQELLSRKPVWE